MEFSRPSGYLPYPGVEPESTSFQVDSLLSEPPVAKKKKKNYKQKDPWGVEIFVTCDRSRISRLTIFKTLINQW